MLSYLQAQLFSDNQFPSSSNFQKIIFQLQSDCKSISEEVNLYQQKISQLPLQLRHKIHNQSQNYFLNPQSEQQYNEQSHQTSDLILKEQSVLHQSNQQSNKDDNSPNIFASMIQKQVLEQKLKSLQEQEQQIQYIAKISDMYLRCKKDQIAQTQEIDQISDVKLRMHHKRSILQRQELQQMSSFIHFIQVSQQTQDSLLSTLLTQIKYHTTKKLTEKCENLIHFNNQQLIIECYLIRNCRQIILGENGQGFGKIVDKWMGKVLGEVLWYDVCWQKMVLMATQDNSQVQPDNQPHSIKLVDTINQTKLLFAPSQTHQHFPTIKSTLTTHLNKLSLVSSLLFNNQQPDPIYSKLLEKHISLIKNHLEYILPFINISQRKELIEILSLEKDLKIDFEDLVLGLKYKGQDGDMFMSNLQAVYKRIVQVSENGQIRLNQENFHTLCNFFELGISQAQQSLLESGSKAIIKLTTGLSRLHNKQKPHMTVTSTKFRSKKLFNMIFFSVTSLVQKLDQFIDKLSEKYQNQQQVNQQLQEKVSQWSFKLIQIRQRVRRRVHQE